MDATQNRILIVDDDPLNVRVLVELLRSQFTLSIARDGQETLDLLGRSVLPDLILLDVMMPGMDGFTVCRQFKSDPQLAGIPILFLSAVTTMSEKVRAFDEGGVDYITKPFNMAEVEARVKTHILLQRQKQELAVRNQQLVELELIFITNYLLKLKLLQWIGKFTLIHLSIMDFQ
jgi:putative two-component system response regulator